MVADLLHENFYYKFTKVKVQSIHKLQPFLCSLSPTIFWYFQVVEEWNTDVKWVSPLSANPTKWSNTLKEFIGNLPMTCLSVFNIWWGWRLKGWSDIILPLISVSLFLLFKFLIIQKSFLIIQKSLNGSRVEFLNWAVLLNFRWYRIPMV